MFIEFATSADLPDLTPDDLIAVEALRARGMRVEPIVWSAPARVDDQDRFDDAPPRPDAVLIRSCWDYHLRSGAFRAWIARLESRGVRVINAPALLLWNLHKSYLADLQAHGIAAVPTALTRRGETRTLRDIIDAAGWAEAVVKPAVSLSAWQTWRVPARDAAEHEDRFERLRSAGDVLVQQFLPQVTSDGEWSLMFFGDRFSHAVRKLPKNGDFRVQSEHGGSATAEIPAARLIDDAARALNALPVRPVYCRIDGVIVGGVFVVMEVECIDPVLFFEQHPPAAEHFADAVADYLTCSRR
jgi:glutathione synthase/RimK-type ligase-like ATP-grasp enzyme